MRQIYVMTLLLIFVGIANSQEPFGGNNNPVARPNPVVSEPADTGLIQPYASVDPVTNPGEGCWDTSNFGCCSSRGLFRSDDAFPRFISPITNPIFAKDPRSQTEAQFLFINNWFPEDHAAFQGGELQAYALQLRLALTDRLTLIADKDGIARLSPGNARSQTGLLNLGVGLRYLFIRDVENQFLLSGGIMFEPQTGSGSVFQNHGDGTFTVFATAAKEFAKVNHAIINVGYQFPVDEKSNSSFFYTSLHFDRQIAGWLYPLVELNWYHYSASGDRGIPSVVGEGDGLLNIGTSDVAGNDLVTFAVGLTALFNRRFETGIAYETPLSNREDLIDHRLNFHLIVRY